MVVRARAQAARLLNQQATPATAEGRRQSSEALLAKPLHVENAVTLALLNNPRLQRQFADLRITETELVASTRPRNPSVTLARLTQGTESEVDRSIVVDVIGLLLSPLRTPIANQQYQNAKLVTVQSVLKLAHDTRVAYVEAIASVQRARYAVDVQTAAEAVVIWRVVWQWLAISVAWMQRGSRLFMPQRRQIVSVLRQTRRWLVNVLSASWDLTTTNH